MTESLVQSWHDYFVTVAQVSATLAGLLFVGLTISLGHMLSVRGYLYRAWAALFLQFEALVIGLFTLIPTQPPAALGGEYIATGLGVLAAIRVFGHYFPEDERSHVLGSKGARLTREVLIHTATLLPVLAGTLVIAGSGRAFFWLIPSQVIGLYLSFGLAWVFAIEIPRRAQE
ncbi:MAG: hypothetical protein JO261_06510 [Alphaproteobacteria bacterium]|nr:hypothetical protein [Alphaproteobacteria bacterium]MBV9693336.1 hypothetical protein [Alphaproteobacteria bacterium]